MREGLNAKSYWRREARDLKKGSGIDVRQPKKEEGGRLATERHY